MLIYLYLFAIIVPLPLVLIFASNYDEKFNGFSGFMPLEKPDRRLDYLLVISICIGPSIIACFLPIENLKDLIGSAAGMFVSCGAFVCRYIINH